MSVETVPFGLVMRTSGAAAVPMNSILICWLFTVISNVPVVNPAFVETKLPELIVVTSKAPKPANVPVVDELMVVQVKRPVATCTVQLELNRLVALCAAPFTVPVAA